MIRRFTIRGFKLFDNDTVLDLEDVTLLVGASNSGKSTVLQSLNLFQYCIETTRKPGNNGRNGRGAFSFETRTISPDEFGALPVASPADIWSQGRTKSPILLRAEYGSGGALGFELSVTYNRFTIRPDFSGDLSAAVRDGGIRLIPIFSGFLAQEEYLTPPARVDRLRLQRHGETIRNLLWDLRTNAPDRWKRLIGILNRMFPESLVKVDFAMEVDRFIRAMYRDQALTKELDIISAGSGFHQALQIFASVLAPGAGVILLDEPDAHLHARLQAMLMDVFISMAKEDDTQFVIATHSPSLAGAVAPSSLRVCMGDRIVPFTKDPAQLEILETIGAMDRMEIIPLLAHRNVVFVENKSDRFLLECFAKKLWDLQRQARIWSQLSFLYTYGDPVSANVLNLARQVRDLLKAADGLDPRRVRFVAVGDRDFRPDRSRREALRILRRKALTEAYALDFTPRLWEANEIENYLLDEDAMVKALGRQACDRGVGSWDAKAQAFRGHLRDLVRGQQEEVRRRIASRIDQDSGGRLGLTSAMAQSDALLEAQWGDGLRWCDAKKILSGLRKWLQDERLCLSLRETELIEEMQEVPKDVRGVLGAVKSLTTQRRPKARSKGIRCTKATKKGETKRRSG